MNEPRKEILTMKLKNLFVLMLAALLVVSLSVAQEMNKEQWQQEINKYNAQLADLQAEAKTLEGQIAAETTQSAKLDEDYKKCMDELYALVGADADKAAAYRSEIEAAEAKADGLMKLSDADLIEEKDDVDALA